MAIDEQKAQSQMAANSKGLSSIVCLGIFILIVFFTILGAPRGGWAWGYGIVPLILGLVPILFGVVLAILGIAKHSKSVISIVGLTLNGIILICFLPIAPLVLKVIGGAFSSGKPSPTDRAWYMMESNRVKIVAALPAQDQNTGMATFYFLGEHLSQIRNKDAKEIEDKINVYINDAGRMSDLERSQKVIGSLKSIEHRYEHLRPSNNNTIELHQQ